MPSGSVTNANMRLSIVNGTAFCDFSASSVLTDYLGSRLEISDSAGKKLIGYIKGAGTGETYGSELVTNGGMETGNPPTGWSSQSGATLAGAADERTGGSGSQSLSVTRGTAAYSCGRSTAVTNASLVYCEVWGRQVTTTWGYVFNQFNPGTTSSTSWTKKTGYTTCSATSHTCAIYIGANGLEARFDDISVKQVLTPSSTGVTITSTVDGSTYNWVSEESGFNRNDSSGYTYLIQKSLPVLIQQYRMRG